MFFTGAYSDSGGVSVIREDIAKFISDRDGHPANQNHVFLSTGASDGIKVMCFSSLVIQPIFFWPHDEACVLLRVAGWDLAFISTERVVRFY